MSSEPPNEDHSKNDPSKSSNDIANIRLSRRSLSPRTNNRIRELDSILTNRPGVHSSRHMTAAGFQYTGNGDTARCNDCELEISNWTQDMTPFVIHAKQRPNCSFVRSLITSALSTLPPAVSSSTTAIRNTSLLTEQENPSKRLKIETTNSENLSNTLLETELLQQVRTRSFSHWPHRTIPSSAQMIEAGFFNCNVGDRVICVHCNLICQQWTSHTDDPYEVHKTLSPNCRYVKAKLIHSKPLTIINPDESSTSTAANNHQNTSNHLCLSRFDQIVFSAACNSKYSELPERHASFITWSNENSPPVEDLVQAGFFYTGRKTTVTCFYCNGSLQNWGPNDNPMIEHARWFPHCAYARQLCGDELYQKIQESKRAHKQCVGIGGSSETTGSNNVYNTNIPRNIDRLWIPDENTLSRLVVERLDWPISQRLLDQNFKLSVIKRCWEDQLRLKQDDFVSECDLYVACLILQKQIEHINGKKENIVIPSVKMKQIRQQNEAQLRKQALNLTRIISNTTDVEITTSLQSLTNDSTLSQPSVDSTSESTTTDSQNETKSNTQTTSTTQDQELSANGMPSNPCVLCFSEEKRLACIPCGHLSICVPCGHSLRFCPVCRREIEAFVRIYT